MIRPLSPFVVALLAAGALVASGCGGGAAPLPPASTGPADLAAPPPQEGLQMKTEAFQVPAGTEVQSCYFFKVSELAAAAGFDPMAPINVHRVQIVQKAGSHHMNLFRVRTIKGLDPANGTVHGTNGQGPCFVSSNWSDWPLIANDQGAGTEDWSYPDGVVNQLNPPDLRRTIPDETLMLQTHFVNATTQTTPDGLGQVAVNLWTLPAAQVTAQIGTLFATNQNINICQSNPTPTFSASFNFNSPAAVTIIGANGHFHSRGTKFDIFAWDGTSTTPPDASARFYESTTWNEPPMLHSPELQLTVPAHGGIWYTCDYQWQPPVASVAGGCATLNSYEQAHPPPDGTAIQQDCCYRFGPQVDANEHCNAFVYYYPKQ